MESWGGSDTKRWKPSFACLPEVPSCLLACLPCPGRLLLLVLLRSSVTTPRICNVTDRKSVTSNQYPRPCDAGQCRKVWADRFGETAIRNQMQLVGQLGGNPGTPKGGEARRRWPIQGPSRLVIAPRDPPTHAAQALQQLCNRGHRAGVARGKFCVPGRPRTALPDGRLAPQRKGNTSRSEYILWNLITER